MISGQLLRASLVVCCGLLWLVISSGDGLTAISSSSNDDDINKSEILDRNLSVIVRHKRQISASCPTTEASGSDKGQNSYLLMYSPKLKSYVRIERNSRGWIERDLDKMDRGGFDASLPTLIYSHAWAQSAQAFWLQEVRRTFSKEFISTNNQQEFNLILFDWSEYALRAYKQSVSYVPHLGRALGQFLTDLSSRYGYNMSQMHLISYSLGTHIVGFAGREIQQKIGQKVGKLTALDPTGVCLQDKTSFAERYSLKMSDAELVVARHYDMGNFGARRPIGGLDIYVNGGSNQPAGRTKRQSSILYRSGSSHRRTVDHEMTPDGDDKCYEVAYACRDRSAFLRGECGDCGRRGEKCYYIHILQEVELKAQNINVNTAIYKRGTSMYLETRPEAPFCLHHYQVVVTLKPNTAQSDKRLLEKGLVAIEINSGVEAKPRNGIGNQKYTTLVLSNRKIDTLSENLKVKVDSSQVEKFARNIELVEINYMSHILASKRALVSGKYKWDSTMGKLSKQ